MRRLFYYPLCAFSRQALLALEEKKLDVEVEVTPFWDPNSGLLEMNAFGRLPVLVELNGAVISGVYAVMEYLEDAYDQAKLLGGDLAFRAEARRIFQWFNEDFAAEITIPLVFERDIKRRIPTAASAPSSAVMRRIRQTLPGYLKQLEWFAERRNWLAGNDLSIADIAAAAHISTIDYLGSVPWSAFPVAKEWYSRIKSRPSFKRVLADRIPSLPPVSYYALLDF